MKHEGRAPTEDTIVEAIATLREENRRLREALKEICGAVFGMPFTGTAEQSTQIYDALRDIREALGDDA